MSVSSYKPRDRRLVASIYISTINREHVFINALSSNKMKHFISLGGLSTDPLLKLLPSSPATGFYCSLFSLRFNITFLLSFPYLPLPPPSPSTLSLRTIFIASSLFFPQIDLTFYILTLVWLFSTLLCTISCGINYRKIYQTMKSLHLFLVIVSFILVTLMFDSEVIL